MHAQNWRKSSSFSKARLRLHNATIDEKVPLVRDREIHNTTIWLTYLNINEARAFRHRHIQRF